jgi:hypothetical protein
MIMPIRTDWTLDEIVMPEDMNDIGKELNRLKEEDKKLENKKLDKTGGTVTGTINATNLQVGGANVYTTSRKPTSSDIGASPIGHSHDDRYFTEAEMNEKLKTKVSVESGKGLSTNDYTTAEKNKLAGIAAGANVYTHPSSHPATMITEDSTHRFVTDVEKSNWNGKAPKDVATTSVNGLMAAADKVKLNGIANNANNYVHPDNSNTRHVTDSEKNKWNSKADGNHNHFKCGIIDNKDLNDYDGEGLVGLTNNNCTNQPTGGYFYIFNIKYNNSSNNLKQIAYGYNQGQMYTRYRTSGTWSGWTRMYSSTDKPTPADIGALGATAKAESSKTADAVAWANVTGKPTALKNPTTVKVQLNGGTAEGTNQFTYDGSVAKTINITPANIGALASGGTAANSSKLNNKSESSAGTANTIVSRDSAGDIVARLLRTTYADQSTMSGAIAFRTNNSTDNYTRYCNSPSAVRSWLGALSTTGGTVNGTINATNLQVGGNNVYHTNRKPTPADIGAIPEANREIKFFGNVKNGTITFDKTKMKNGVKVSFMTSNKMGTDTWHYAINGKWRDGWTSSQEAKYVFDFTKIKPDGSVWFYEVRIVNGYRATIGSTRYDGSSGLQIGELNTLMVYLDHATNVCDNLTALIEYY